MVKNFPKLIKGKIYIQQKYHSEVNVNKPYYIKKIDDSLRVCVWGGGGNLIFPSHRIK